MKGSLKRLLGLLLPAAMIVVALLLNTACNSGAGGARTYPTSIEETDDPDLARDKQIRKIMEGMTLEEKVYQLFIVLPYALSGTKEGKPYYTVESGFIDSIKEHPVGGIILDKTNVKSEAQLKKLTADMQSYSELPLIVTCDEEGGTVSRLRSLISGPDSLDSMYAYKDKGTGTAKANALTIAAYMVKYGFNADLAPVADVWSNPDNTVIGNRSYSDDFRQAAALVGAAVEGFREGNIACTLKHFPGHGDTVDDSHSSAVHVTKTTAEIRAQEFLPFKAGIEAGAQMVMIGHLNVDALDEDLPATFSSEIITGWLRGELGFKGVVVTDALEMGALDGYTDAQKAIYAVAAGADMLLMLDDLEASANALINAARASAGDQEAANELSEELIASGNAEKITESRIDESVYRILYMKAELGLLVDPQA